MTEVTGTPRILVGIIANDSARYSVFASCVSRLDISDLDAKVEWLIGGDWCGARNTLAQMTLEQGYDYLWFMDDDHAFPPSLLKRLLAHQVYLCNPLCTTRVAPFPLVTYTHKVGENLYLPPLMDGVPEEGLIELEAAGCAGMLIHRAVLEATDARNHPEVTKANGGNWFEYTDRSEDIVFCEKAKAAGFKLYADLGARLGHITTAVVSPVPHEGKWMTLINVGRDLNLFVGMPDELEGMANEATADEGGGEGETAVVPLAEAPSTRPRPEFDIDTAPAGELDGVLEWPVVDGKPESEEEDDYYHLDDSEEVLTHEVVVFEGKDLASEPCLICGTQSTWRDAHGQQGCAEHHPEHSAWLEHYERAEIWFNNSPDVLRWFGRVLNGDGRVAARLDAIQEVDLIGQIEAGYPGLGIHLIQTEMDDSRPHSGMSRRLWDREVRA